MLRRMEQFDDVRLAFATLRGYIEPGGTLNLTEINIHAEDFVGEVLNRLYGWALVPTRTMSARYPGIDLLDRGQKLGIQVTAEGGVDKINDTLRKLATSGGAVEINQLKIFALLGKQGSYAVRDACPGIAFTWKKDVVDFKSTLADVLNATEPKLTAIHEYVTSELPAVFASRREKYEQIRDQLKENLIVFDRDVMRVADRYEDPVLMCRAIRYMRTTLQKSGAARIANEVAAKQFDVAQKVLGETERAIKVRFPYIHKAALELPEQQSLPFDAYKNDDYGESIRTMMEMRPKLSTSLQALEDELRRIEEVL